MKENDFIRFNCRFASELYNWLKSESERTGVSMNAYVVMALETYRRQNEAMGAMGTFEDFYKRLQEQEGAEE